MSVKILSEEEVHFLRGPLDHVFTFLGEPDVQGTLKEVTLKHDFKKARALEFLVEFDAAAYQAITAAGLFGVTKESRTESLLEEFSAELPIEVQVFLQPEHLKTRFSSGEEAFRGEVSATLKEMLDAESPIKRSDSYTYLTVRQAVAGQSFSAGFANKMYAEPDSHLP